MKKRYDFWEIVFYLSLFVLFIWVILKITGVIQTPLWLEFGVPALSIISIVLAFFKEIMEPIKQTTIGLATLNIKFDHLDKKVDIVDGRLYNVEKDVNILKSDVRVLKIDVDFLKKKII